MVGIEIRSLGTEQACEQLVERARAPFDKLRVSGERPGERRKAL
jgi:hypothetical protein